MFSYDIHKGDGLIVLTSTGKTTFDDYQTVAPNFYADVKLHGIRKILLDAHQFTGWESEEAESLTFDSWIKSRSLFDRIALVVDDTSKSEITRFLEFFRDAGNDVGVFPPSQYETALDWLKEDGNEDEQEDAPA